MISLLLSLSLMSFVETPHFKLGIPSPYLGYGASLTAKKSSTEETTISSFPKYWFVGVPVKFVWKTSKLLNDDAFSGFRFVATPEFGFNSKTFMLNMMVGGETSQSLGYRQRLSSIDYGSQLGFHYGILFGDATSSSGENVSTDSKTAFAAIFNFYAGPRFDLSEKVGMRFLINPRFLVGSIPSTLYRSEFSQWVGWMLSFNLQMDFL